MPDPDLSWSPLDQAAVSAAAGAAWSVSLLPSAASTNAVAADRPETGLVVLADHQTAGRGRLDRSWETPPGSALTFSAVVDPGVPDQDWPLLPLASAVAVAQGVRRSTGLDPRLKWPNDVLLARQDGGEGKVAGILLERVADPAGRALAVIGIGINVGMTRDQLPVETATSLRIAGADVDRTAVFGAVVEELADTIAELATDPQAVLRRYRDDCTTLGAQVEVHLPGGEMITGVASEVDGHGRLVVDGRAIGAGDVVHVRPGV